ncbi:MAG TPA: hypothetical protein PKE26_16955, partial [Kiritimatiellia bacterium]|nr:hypothetical protein [Kiritimatiellia bacterium]HMP00788.1 hypothetical protein [Kiritimatiellia bacterium]
FSTDVPGARIVDGNLTNNNFYSLRFRKSGGLVRILEPTRLALTNVPAAFTVEAFIKIDSPDYPMRIIDARFGGVPEPPPRTVISPFLSFFDPAPLMSLSVHSDLTTNYVTVFASGAVNPSPLVPRHWHHVAWVMNGTSTLFYADYQLISGAGMIAAGYEPGAFTNINQVSLGAIAGQNFNNVDGWLDEIRLTDRALAPSEFLRVVGGLAPGIRAFPSPESPTLVTVVTEEGERYQLQGTTNLLATPQVWTNLTTVVTGNQFYTTFGVGGAPARYYRVNRLATP